MFSLYSDQIPINIDTYEIYNYEEKIIEQNNNCYYNDVDYSIKDGTICDCNIVLMLTKEDVVENIKKTFEELWQDKQDNLYLRLSNRLQDLLDIEFLKEEEILPQYDSFINCINFLKNYKNINKFKFAITMTDNGEMSITSDIVTHLFFSICFIDKTNIAYHILNRNTGKETYDPKGTTEELKKGLEKYYA